MSSKKLKLRPRPEWDQTADEGLYGLSGIQERVKRLKMDDSVVERGNRESKEKAIHETKENSEVRLS